jgi:hypothetical protein
LSCEKGQNASQDISCAEGQSHAGGDGSEQRFRDLIKSERHAAWRHVETSLDEARSKVSGHRGGCDRCADAPGEAHQWRRAR